jgi:hypothetical protein
MIHPPSFTVAKVSIPANPDPIQFEALDRKFASYILQIIRGSDIRIVVEKPVGWFDLRLDVYSFRSQPLST